MIGDKITKHISETEKNKSGELKYLNKKLDDTIKKLNQVMNILETGIFDEETLSQRMNALAKERDHYRNMILEIENKNYNWINKDKITTFLKKYKENLSSEDNLLKKSSRNICR